MLIANSSFRAQVQRSIQLLLECRPEGSYPRPLPLRRALGPAEPFPLAALSPKLKEMADLMMQTVQAPPALCGQSLLAAANLAVQAHANVLIDGRSFPVSEFFLSVGESGERKSAIDRLTLAPHREYERRLVHAFAIEEEAFKKAKAIYEKQWEACLKGGKKSSNSQQDELDRPANGRCDLHRAI